MLAVQYIVLSCNGTCNYALRHGFKLQARYEKCIGPFKGPVNAVIHTKKLHKQTNLKYGKTATDSDSANSISINKEPNRRAHLTLS